MGTPTLIGVAAPRAAYTARYLHCGEHPDTLVPLLRRIWAETFSRDPAAATTALLARDWSVSPQIPAGSATTGTGRWPGSATPPQPVTASYGTDSSARTSTDSWNGCI